MPKMRIFLGDLEHTWKKVSIWTFPLNVGYVGAYAKKQFPEDVEVTLFKDPEEMVQAIRDSNPDVVGLTYYVWGVNLANHVAAIAKAHNPNVLTVGGGPHFTSLNADEQTARRFFSDEGSNCDAFVVNQGERGFSELISQFFSCDMSVDRLRQETIAGCLVNNLTAEDSVQVGLALPTINDLDEIPSPYLTGLMDRFFAGPYAPILETNRSCPYRCTFCAWGIGTEKLARYGDDRVSAEIEYFGKRSTKTKNLYIADANFAILERDANISKQLYQSYEKYGYPGNVMVNWNKTRPDRVLNAAREFHGLARIGASMQSLHQPTLDAIKRKNLPLATVAEMSAELSGTDTHLFSELILGLPEETWESHLDGIKKLMDVGAEIYNYNLHMLPGTELNDPESRESHIKKTAWRLFDGCYGIYDGQKVFEGEEVVVATSTMPEEELRSFRFIHFFIQLMWSKEWYKDLLFVFKQWGTHPADTITKIATACQNDGSPMGDVARRFREDHDLENFQDFQDLSDYWSESEAFERLSAGGYGKLNYVYTFDVLLEHRQEFNELLLQVAGDLAQQTGISDPGEFINQCQEVLRFSQALQFDLSDPSKMGAVKYIGFDYDVLSWKDGGYKQPLAPADNGQHEYEFYLPDEQRKFLETQLQQFKSHNVNMTIRKLSEGVSPDHLLYKVRPSVPSEHSSPIKSHS